MAEKPREDISFMVFSVVLGVVLVVGVVGILAVAGLMMYRSQAAQAESLRAEAVAELQKTQAQLESREEQLLESDRGDEVPGERLPPGDVVGLLDAPLVGDAVALVKPGALLRAQRPAHWDDVEVIDILEGSQIKVRWLSGAPGEDVIALDHVRSDVLPAN